MFNILFVCTENTCRSPMAKYILKKILADVGAKKVSVDSCGLYVTTASKLATNARMVLKELGQNVRHKPKQINAALVKNADLVICMTLQQKVDVSLRFECLDKLYTFAEIAGGEDVSDPYGGSLQIYRHCAEIIYDKCASLTRSLIKKGVFNVS